MAYGRATAAVVALTACAPSSAPTDSEPHVTGSGFPYLGLTSKAVDLGLVHVGSSADATVAIANVGVADLELADVRLAASEPSVTLDWPGPTSVPAGEFISVAIHWAPTTFEDLATSLQVVSNDVVRPLAEVALIGATPDPDIDVTPGTWDFGTVEVGSTNVMGVSIANVGAADLTITSLDFTASDGDLTIDDATLPAIVPPSEALDLRVTYKPVNVGVDSGTLVVGSNDPDEALVTVGQSAAASSTYDAFDDFDYKSNDETHVWQYGTASSVGGAFSLSTGTFDYPSTSGWSPSSDCPNVARSTTEKDDEWNGVHWPGSTFVTMHPGCSAPKYSVLRFVVPSDGAWRIDAGFEIVSLSSHPGATDVHVLVAGVERFGAVVTGPYDGDLSIDDPYEETLTLSLGDTVDFVVGPGPNQSYSYDTTAVRATVTLE